jgi:MFS family permease
VASAAPAGSHDSEVDATRWRAFSVCLVAAFMTLLDVSIVNVALPSIRTGLQASQTQLQWIVSGYALAFGLVLVPAGRLGDLHGRRTVFVSSLALFTAASAGCGLARSAAWLIVARLVQGVAGGMLNPQVSGFVQELFTGPRRGRAFGLQGSVIGLSTAVGPLAGGGLISLFGVERGWRSVFFVNVPIGLVAIMLAIRLLPVSAGSGRRESLDPVGMILLGAGTGLLLLPLVEERTGGAALIWRLMPASAAVLIVFVLWERRHAVGARSR